MWSGGGEEGDGGDSGDGGDGIACRTTIHFAYNHLTVCRVPLGGGMW